jgi:hypothetical protein
MIFNTLRHRVEKTLRGLLTLAGPVHNCRPIELAWGTGSLRFEVPTDFAFALSARTNVPPHRMQELMLGSRAELEIEALKIFNLEQGIGDIINAYDSVMQPCGPAITRLGVDVFSKDFEWRSVFARLVELPADRDSFVRVALIKYLQYLKARRSAVQLAIASKVPTTLADGDTQAMLLRSSSSPLRPFDRDELRRLPQGEAVTLHLASGSAVSLKLAKHAFSLAHNREWTLIADDGKSYTLHAGVNRVGRGWNNDIALGADFRNVSRQHLLAQPLADDAILLTDISAHGTYVPPTALAS